MKLRESIWRALGQGKKRVEFPTDLNCPAIEITLVDAYAYAKWLGAPDWHGA
jgi:hypothetical protein